jgi:RNA polymerase sigma-70 factor (ECF subfamily)
MTGEAPTCWTVIRAAAGGAAVERAAFAQRYSEPLRAYFAARWRGGPRAQEAEDAVQEVFVECLREGGALDRADPARGPFQAFLRGVARNVARRFEERAAVARRAGSPGDSVELDALPIDEPSLSRAFDRAFAKALLHEAAELQSRRAATEGARALRRVELLKRRFGDDQAIRDMAASFGVTAAELHHEYATARREFLVALKDVVAFHEPGATPGEVVRRCQELGRLVAG